MSAKPRRMMAPAGKAPRPGQPVSARDSPRFGRAGRTPGNDAPLRAKDLLRHLRIEKGRSHRATGSLAQAPRGAGVVLRHLLDDLHIHSRGQLRAAEGTGQQQAKEPALDERLDDRLGKLAAALDFFGSRVELGTKLPRALDVIRDRHLGTLNTSGGQAHRRLYSSRNKSNSSPPRRRGSRALCKTLRHLDSRFRENDDLRRPYVGCARIIESNRRGAGESTAKALPSHTRAPASGPLPHRRAFPRVERRAAGRLGCSHNTPTLPGYPSH